jgi:hypothetical protein
MKEVEEEEEAEQEVEANNQVVGNEYKMKDLNGEEKKVELAKIEGLGNVHGYQAHGYTHECLSMYPKEKFVKLMKIKIKIKDDQSKRSSLENESYFLPKSIKSLHLRMSLTFLPKSYDAVTDLQF